METEEWNYDRMAAQAEAFLNVFAAKGYQVHFGRFGEAYPDGAKEHLILHGFKVYMLEKPQNDIMLQTRLDRTSESVSYLEIRVNYDKLKGFELKAGKLNRVRIGGRIIAQRTLDAQDVNSIPSRENAIAILSPTPVEQQIVELSDLFISKGYGGSGLVSSMDQPQVQFREGSDCFIQLAAATGPGRYVNVSHDIRPEGQLEGKMSCDWKVFYDDKKGLCIREVTVSNEGVKGGVNVSRTLLLNSNKEIPTIEQARKQLALQSRKVNKRLRKL